MTAVPRVTLHIGLPKTASTSLQLNFFLRTPELVYVGKPLIYYSNRVRELFRTLTMVERWEYEQGLETFRREVVGPLVERGRERVLLSEEELSTGQLSGRVDRFEIARRLHGLFPTAQILLVARNQVELLPSVYAHLVRMGLVPGLTFGQWLESQRQRPHSLLHLFRVSDVASIYAELFGAERVHVLLFEDFQRAPRPFLTRVARIVGVEPERALENYRDVRRNPRITRRQRQWGELRRLLPWLRQPEELQHKRLRELLTRFLQGGAPLDVAYTGEQRGFVSDYYRESNRVLAARFGLDLGAQGYPV